MTNPIWNFDPAHSNIGFKVRHMMVSRVSGRFENWSGEITFDPANPGVSQAKVEIDVNSINTNVADRDAHLRSADFFDAANFPTIQYATTRVEKIDDETFRFHGNLTIRGTTRDLTFDANYHGTAVDPWGKRRSGFDAKLQLSRKDFGLTWNQALETGGVVVSDKIEIELEIELVSE